MTAASAPGRVNLIGEHTDYNGGFVLPVALPLYVNVELTMRGDLVVRGSSEALDAGRWQERTLDDPADRRWTDHILGPGVMLARIGALDRGYDVRITSDIPVGAGLGSSGSLGVALLRALRSANGLDIDDLALARLAQRSENEFVGAQSGIMDQFAASLGRENEALFIDCRSLEFTRIRLPDALELVVIDSGVRHQHATGEYNERRQITHAVARRLGVRDLRSLNLSDLPRVERQGYRSMHYARHVLTENARVLEAVAALSAADVGRLGGLLDASHRSLRDDYEVSTPEIDLLVDLLREQAGIYGARITGGGFGGSVVAAADPGAGHHAAAKAVAEYGQRTGLDARVIMPALEPDEVSPA